MKVLEEYSVSSEGVPAEIAVVEDDNEFVNLYELSHTKLKPATAAALNFLKEKIIEGVNIKISEMLDPRESENVRKRIVKKARELVEKELAGLSDEEETIIVGRLAQEMMGLGELELVLADENLEEVVINSAKENVWVYHKKHGWLKTNLVIPTEETIHNYASIIGRKIGRQITNLDPLMDAHLLTGDRVNATLFPISTKGNSITIRKFARDPWTIISLIGNKTLSIEAAAVIWLAVQYELSLVIGGGTASGKCVSGNTRVWVEGKGYVPIKEIVEKQLSSSTAVEKTSDGFLTAPCEPIEVQTLDPRTLESKASFVSRVWKRKAPEKIILVKTRTGREIKTTPEHPFFVSENGLTKVRADELKRKSFIATTRRLETRAHKQEFDLHKLNAVFREENGVTYAKPAKGNFHKWVKLAGEPTPELARLVGYVLGDGHIMKDGQAVRFFNEDKQILADFAQMASAVFGVLPRFYKFNTRTPYFELNSRVACEFLTRILGIPAGLKSHSAAIPTCFFAAGEEILKECLIGLFESEVYIDSRKGQLEFTSASAQLVKDVSAALYVLGVPNETKLGSSRSRLFLGGVHLKQLAEKLELVSEKNAGRLALAASHRRSQNLDTVPQIATTLRELKNKLRLYDKEIGTTLTREAITRYTNSERNPTRESLHQVAANLRGRFVELNALKREVASLSEIASANTEMLEIIREAAREIRVGWNELGIRTGVDKTTICQWMSGTEKPRAEYLNKLVPAMREGYHAAIERLSQGFSDVAKLRAASITAPEIAAEMGESVWNVYAWLKRDLNRVKPALETIRLGRIEKLRTLERRMERLGDLAEKNTPNALQKRIREIKENLKIAYQLEKHSTALDKIRQVLQEATSEAMNEKIELLERLADSDIMWDEVLEVKQIIPEEEWVYDLTVDGTHNFVAEGIFAHNTSFLNSILVFTPPNQRIVSIEDSVTGDAEILAQRNGVIEKTTLGKLVDGLIEQYGCSKSGGVEIVPTNFENINVFALDSSKTIRLAPVSQFIRHKVEKPIYEVRTFGGRSIKVTGDHSLFVLERGQVEPIKTSELKAGDYIAAAPRTLETLALNSSVNQQHGGLLQATALYSKVLWDRVVSVENIAESSEQYVYDLSVPGCESFVCNNIVAHNTRELILPDFLHWTPMTTRQANPEGKGKITMLDLMVNSLRMRPDRIVLGEIRRKREAEVLFEAMHTGHSVYSTVHADDAAQVRNRLISPPIELPESVLSALQLVVVQYRQRRTGIRRTFEIAEVMPSEEGVTMNIIYKWDARDDALRKVGDMLRITNDLAMHTGMSQKEISDDLEEKQVILSSMLEKGISKVNDVGKIIGSYYRSRDRVVELAKKGQLIKLLVQ